MIRNSKYCNRQLTTVSFKYHIIFYLLFFCVLKIEIFITDAIVVCWYLKAGCQQQCSRSILWKTRHLNFDVRCACASGDVPLYSCGLNINRPIVVMTTAPNFDLTKLSTSPSAGDHDFILFYLTPASRLRISLFYKYFTFKQNQEIVHLIELFCIHS